MKSIRIILTLTFLFIVILAVGNFVFAEQGDIQRKGAGAVEDFTESYSYENTAAIGDLEWEIKGIKSPILVMFSYVVFLNLLSAIMSYLKRKVEEKELEENSKGKIGEVK